MTRQRFAVITTRNRPDDFADCVAAIRPQVDTVIVVAHMYPAYLPHPDVFEGKYPGVDYIVDYTEDPPNISRMWNLGLDRARTIASTADYDVAVLNDDAIVKQQWFERVTAEMDSADAAAGASSPDGTYHFLNNKNKPLPRMPGYAFILASEWNLRLDERFQWWWGDTDLDWQARDLSSVVLVPGVDVEHRHPNSTTVGVLADIAAEDRKRFVAKHGKAPW